MKIVEDAVEMIQNFIIKINVDIVELQKNPYK